MHRIPYDSGLVTVRHERFEEEAHSLVGKATAIVETGLGHQG